jgi:hypothetical protein
VAAQVRQQAWRLPLAPISAALTDLDHRCMAGEQVGHPRPSAIVDVVVRPALQRLAG